MPPPPEVVTDCLQHWERFLHDETLPPLIHAGLTHAQFEAIHPFRDGNGRVGRLVTTLLLVERNVLKAPLLYLSAWFEADTVGILRTPAGHDRGRRMARVARLLPERGRQRSGRCRETDSDHRRSDAPLAGATGQGEIESARDRAGAVPGEPVLDHEGESPDAWTSPSPPRAGRSNGCKAAGIVSPAGDAQRNRVFCARQMLEVLERR